jgi:cytoskeletal protein CcmA (bactofilin family)
VFGNDYGDEHFFSGSVKMFGPLVMREGFLGASGNQTAFIDISGSITSSGQLKVNGITSSFISASTFVSASNFYGEYNGVSTQVHLSQSIGYNSLTASISGAINAASNSLSASITTTTNMLSGSVDVLFTSASSLRISASANRNNIIFLYTSASSLETSASLLSTITSASIASGSANQQSGSANKQSGSILFTSASSLQLSASALQTSASVMITSASNLSAYTHSLQQSISVTGSNLRVLGNANIQNDLIVSGNIIAQQYIVSSSVTYMTTSFSNGSTIFGNDTNDTHRFTGSVYITNDITASNVRGTIIANNGLVSSSTQFVNYGALLTSSVSGRQAISGTLIVSGNTSITGSTNIDLRSGSEFYVRNGVTRIDSVLFVTDNDYVNSSYVGGDVKVNDYLAGGYTAHYDGGVQITGSLRVNAGQNGSGSYFTGSVWITGNEAVSGNLQVVGNSSVSGNFIGTTISASSAVTASSLRVEGLTRINGVVDIDTTEITIGAGGNAEVNETRVNTTNLRVDSFSKFFGGIEATSSMTELLSLKIKNRNSDGILYMDDLGSGVEVADSANFTYDGVTFKVGNGDFEIDNATGNIRTSGSLKVDGATTLHTTLNVSGAVGITGSLIVTGSTIISSSLRVNNTASFAHLNVTGSTNVTGSLSVGGALAVSGSTRVSGNFAVSGTLDISGSATFDSYVNITGGLAVTGGFSVKGEPVLIGDSMTDSIIISGGLEITGSLTRNTTNLKATGSNNPADAIYRLTEAQAWSSSFTTDNTSSGAWIRTPDEYLEYFVGQGSNKRRYITPVWLDETLYADDYFDISVVSGADSDYVF